MTTQQRIAKTGCVIRYPAIEALAEPEYWYVCDTNGIIATRGANGLNAAECNALVQSGALVARQTLQGEGATIYETATASEVTQ